MGSPVGALIRREAGLWEYFVHREGERESSGWRGEGMGSLGSIVASRRSYLLYTRCLCRLADSVDSRLKSRTFVRAPRSLSFSLPPPLFLPLRRGSAVIAANVVRIGEKPSRRSPRTGLSIYRSCAAHLHPEPMNSLSTITLRFRWLITEE